MSEYDFLIGPVLPVCGHLESILHTHVIWFKMVEKRAGQPNVYCGWNFFSWIVLLSSGIFIGVGMHAKLL